MKFKFFTKLVLIFIAFSIIGTQTHELGHYFAAKYLGMNPSLHYKSVGFGEDKNEKEINKILKQYQKEIYEEKDFPLKARYLLLEREYDKNNFYSRLWGPLQTMLTGTIGFTLLIFFRRKYIYSNELNRNEWLIIFLALFWLRQVANCVVAFFIMIFTGRKEFLGDEFLLSEYLSLHNFTIPIITGIIGLIICSIVVFKFVPLPQQKIFIAAGLVGGVLGFILWMYILGPLVLP